MSHEEINILRKTAGTGVAEPIFASAVPAVHRTQLRDVLKEVVAAYAQNLDSSRAELDSVGLRDALRQKVAARKTRHAGSS